MNNLDFVKKGRVIPKYLTDGCEFKKVNNSYKLVSTSNDKYEPFVGKTFSEPIWDLISKSTITSGEKYNEFYMLLLDHFKSGHTIFNKESNILLKKGEHIVFQSPNNISLKEPKSVRVTNSVHVGSGKRRNNTSFGYGASKSVGETQEVIKIIDVGQVIITNKRFIYSGNKRNIDVNISQITGITPYSDGFKLQRKSKQKPEYFTNIDAYAFNYTFKDDTYFFLMNGRIIKYLIEGGLNKSPKKSKLQVLSAQKQIKKPIDLIRFKHEDLVLEYSSNWKKIENQKDSNILTLERINGSYRSEIFISKSVIPQNQEKFENDLKDFFKRNEFVISDFKKIEINGIEMLCVSSSKKNNDAVVEFDVTYFNNQKYNFSIFLTNNLLNTIAKDDYDSIIKSVNFINSDENSGSKVNFCPNCGTHVESEAKFCINCGFKIY